MQLHRPEAIEELKRREANLLVISFAPMQSLREWIPFFLENSLRPALKAGQGQDPRQIHSLLGRTRFLSDPGLCTYHAFGLGKLSLRSALTPRVLWRYAQWAMAGRKLSRPRGDGFQQGGDFVVDRDGRLTLSRPASSPDDRPSIGIILEALDRERFFHADRLKSKFQERADFPSRQTDRETSTMMWKKNEPEEQPFRQPAPSPPQQAPPAVQPADRAVIGPTIEIKGTLKGEEDLLIQGAVEGKVELLRHSITVGKKGHARADICGRIICIEGEVQGNLFGEEQIILRTSSTVRGNLAAPRVTMEDGANFKGGIDMTQGKPAETSTVGAPEKPEGRMPVIQRPIRTGTAPAPEAKTDLQTQRQGSVEPNR